MSKTKILVVDDELEAVDSFRAILERMGYAVTGFAVTGEEAIEMAKTRHPDIILMDIILEGELDGIEAARRINEGCDIPTLFLTAHADDSLLDRAKGSAAFGYLIKPFKSRELKMMLEMALYKHRTERELRRQAEDLRELNQTLHRRVREETRKRLQQEQLLIQQSKQAALGEMIGAIAHQWRQPLAGLSLLIESLLYAYDSQKLDRKLLEEIFSEASEQIQFMSKTIEDFGNFFNPVMRKSTFDVTQAIREVLGILSAQLKDNFINTEITAPETPQRVTGFPNEFKHVILNIISNAKDAILSREGEEIYREKGLVTIHVSDGKEEVSIEISDNAGGIPEPLLEKIFEQSFSTKGDRGTGIGLYLSRVIIEGNMKGSVRARNLAEGACFTIRLKKSGR